MENYSIDYIEPLETSSYKDDFSRKMISKVDNLSKEITKSHAALEKKLESIINIWMDFITTLKNSEVGEESDEESPMSELITQTNVLIDQNNKILTQLDGISSRVDRLERSSKEPSRISSHRMAPRKYPKIRIVK